MLRRGSLLLEAVLAIAVFGILLSAVGVTLLYGQENSVAGGERYRGVAIAQEGLEAARAIRDGGFAGLTAGQHGIALNAQQQWVFSGTHGTRSGGYILDLTVTSAASNRVEVAARSRWKHGYGRSGSILVSTELTDWRGSRYAGDWSSLSVDGSYVDGGTPRFNAVATAGNYAYITSETSGGGAGLYVFDISNTASPSRVANTFTLGAAGYGVAAKGNTLYVLTSDASSEIRAYDITNPAALAAGNLLTSHSLSGSSLGVSMLLRGPYLYIGTAADATYKEFRSFDVRSTGSILPLGALEVGTTVQGIAAAGTGAYLATGDAAAEMKTVDIDTPSAPVLVGADYNLSGSETGVSVAATGTSALLGRQKGAIQELAVFDLRSGGGNPPPSPGPWYHEGSGSLVGVATDPAKCYGFLAAASGRKALQIINLRDTSLPELTTYTSVTGLARGMLYDIVRDRVLLLTNSAFLIFKPSAVTGSCN